VVDELELILMEGRYVWVDKIALYFVGKLVVGDLESRH